jgi:hypothetical protein
MRNSHKEARKVTKGLFNESVFMCLRNCRSGFIPRFSLFNSYLNLLYRGINPLLQSLIGQSLRRYIY